MGKDEIHVIVELMVYLIGFEIFIKYMYQLTNREFAS